MKKTIYSILFCLLMCISANAQNPNLRYHKDGKFRIIQITDTHFIRGNPASDVVMHLLKEIIENEKPDLVVFTGDMVVENTNTRLALDDLFAPLIKHKIPWAYVFGNHDDEADLTRKEIMDYVMKMPYCLATHGPEDIAGVGNYTLEILGSADDAIKNVLYCMDSHSYSKLDGVKGYAWFEFNQVAWYSKVSQQYFQNNNNQTIPSLAFFHIPLPEYVELAENPKNLVGIRNERECNGKLNTGMFAAMRHSGDIMGMFTGHDHDNDYIGVYYDIALAYGRYSGGKTVYNNLGKNGCRIIDLYENERSFSSYIYLLGGEKMHQFQYPIRKK